MDENKLVTKEEAKKILKENNNQLVDSSIDAFVKLENVNKVYPNGVHAVYDFNLDINKNEFIALVGPSGCGKSTTLRMIAGLEEISSGNLYINKVLSNYLEPKNRNIAMVFQSYALYPQMSVFDNIAFGLKIRHLPKEEIEKRVYEVADILDLGNYLDRKPKELSGGQMQRVALGRAIVRKADVFLMDEPLSNLDAKLRVQMRSEIVRIHKEVNATTIYVTHDQIEAMTMADKIVVMNKGFIQQIGSAKEIYNHPNNLFVATFIGNPIMNIIDSEYKNNEIKINDNFVIKLDSSFNSKYLEFISSQINKLNEQLENFENMNDEAIEMMKASQIYKKEEKKVVQKENFISKIKSLFKKKDIKKNKELEKENIKNELSNLLEKYKNAVQGAKVKIGIRPESIHLAKAFKNKNASQIIKAKPNLIELLGSEYILHFDIFNTDLQMKIPQNEIDNYDEELDLVFDLSKIYIFDVESGLTIY